MPKFYPSLRFDTSEPLVRLTTVKLLTIVN